MKKVLNVYDSGFSKSGVGLALDYVSNLIHHTLITSHLNFHELKKCILVHRELESRIP